MRKLSILILTAVCLSSCASGFPDTSTPTDQPASTSPHSESSFIPSPSATASPTPTFNFVNLPTPTPILYTVVLNDNLTSIAKKYNITLDELVAANPSAGSQALTVGTVLIIPTGQESLSVPTATPVPVVIRQVQCFPNQDESLYCLVLLKNEQSDTLQNLSVLINLESSDGTILNSQISYAPLDLLPSGNSILIVGLFPAPIPQGWQPQARLLTSSRLVSVAPQYPSISLLNSLVEVDWGGLNAHISGLAVLNGTNLSANRVWILGMAFDQDMNIIGFSRWESKTSISSGENLSFEFMVASLGPQIDHVELLVEAAK